MIYQTAWSFPPKQFAQRAIAGADILVGRKVAAAILLEARPHPSESTIGQFEIQGGNSASEGETGPKLPNARSLIELPTFSRSNRQITPLCLTN